MRPLGSYVTSDPWQKGTPTFTRDFQAGTPDFPAQFTRGSNNPIQTTDQRKNHDIICVRDFVNEDDKGYLDHHYQVLIRVLDPRANAMTEFDVLRSSALERAQRMNDKLILQNSSRREKELIAIGGFGPAPAAHLYSVPEWNYLMARRQLEFGEVFTAEQIWRENKITWVGISPSSTMKLYEHNKGPALGTLEVTTVEGPVELHNTFGRVTEQDHCWLRLVLVDANSDLRYRISSSGNWKEIERKADMDKIWQLEYYAGDCEKPRYEGSRTVNGKMEYVLGLNYKLGTVKDAYMKNSFANSLNMMMNTDSGRTQFSRDMLASIKTPTIRLLLDFNSNTFY